MIDTHERMFTSTESRLFLSTVRIQTKAKKNGVATGFYYNYRYDDKLFGCIVTNKHVVENKVEINLSFLKGEKGQPLLGEIYNYQNAYTKNSWILHPEYDLAFLPTHPIFTQLQEKGHVLAIEALNPGLVPNDAFFENLKYIDDVFYVGYPDGLWDSKNFLPLIRYGTMATLLGINYGGQERFLIDADAIPGSSGSPVFIRNSGFLREPTMPIRGGSVWFFVGILDKTFRQRPIIGTEEVPIPLNREEYDIKMRIRLGGVIKVPILCKLIEDFTHTNEIDHLIVRV